MGKDSPPVGLVVLIFPCFQAAAISEWLSHISASRRKIASFERKHLIPPCC